MRELYLLQDDGRPRQPAALGAEAADIAAQFKRELEIGLAGSFDTRHGSRQSALERVLFAD